MKLEEINRKNVTKKSLQIIEILLPTERNLQVCLFGFQYVHTCKKHPITQEVILKDFHLIDVVKKHLVVLTKEVRLWIQHQFDTLSNK